MVKYNTPQEDSKKISSIVKRAGKEIGITDILSLWIDLDAINSNGTPLDFDKLLGFDKFDFGHDIYGMISHLDRETGKLTGKFIPKCKK